MKSPVVVKQFKKSQRLERFFFNRKMERKGYYLYSEEDTEQRGLLKTGILGLIFLPLALAGKSKSVKLTYKLIESDK